MTSIDKLFGSAEFVRILRLFLLNKSSIFESADVQRRARISAEIFRREIKTLEGIRFVTKRTFTVTTKTILSSGKERVTKRKAVGWQLNTDFELLSPLRALLLNTELFKDKRELAGRLRGAGNMKLIIASGVFIHNPDSRADMLIVAERVKKTQFDKAIKVIESEIGKELEYALMDPEEFKYRLEVCDKFVRDILDYPHRVILDKIGI